MSEFKVGDSVRILEEESNFYNMVGTIRSFADNDIWPVTVKYGPHTMDFSYYKKEDLRLATNTEIILFSEGTKIDI